MKNTHYYIQPKILFFLLILGSGLHFTELNAQLCSTYPDVDLGNDTVLCAGETLTLDASGFLGYNSLVWENGTTTTTRTVNSTGEYSISIKYLGDNVITNGNFDAGDSGFTTQYTLGTGGAWGLLSNEGTYAVSTSPSLVHNNFVYCADHTGNNGNMMIVNGSNTSGVQVWCQNVNVDANTDYEFSTWVTNVVNDNNVADLQFTIDGTPLGNQFSPSTSPCNWSQFFETWNSGTATNIDICITNLNTGASGNDFAVDDISFSPICVKKDTISVTFLPNPTFTLPTIYNACEGDSIILNAENLGYDYDWSNGDSLQTITIQQTGNYTVEVTNQDLCSATQTFDVTFHQPPNAGNDSLLLFCNTENNTDLTTLLNPNIDNTGSWYASDYTPLNNNTLIDISQEEGFLPFHYILTHQYCPSDTTTYNLDVKKFYSAGTDAQEHFCNENTSDLNQFINPDANIGTWSALNTTVGAAFNNQTGILDLNGLPKDEYSFAYVIDNEDPCPVDSAYVTIEISEIPNVNFTANRLEGCTPLTIDFSDATIVNGDTEFLWRIDGTTVSNNAQFSHTFIDQTCFDVSLEVNVDNLCTAEKLVPNYICVNPNPTAQFSVTPDVVYADNPEVHFDNTSIDNNENLWNFANLGFSSEVEPSYTFPLGEEQDYLVWLTVTSNKGCKDSVSRIVHVKNNIVYYIPNTFTPDDDLHNPIFKPIMTFGIDPYHYTFLIFDRWGEIVFESHDYRYGWDGTYGNEIAPDGVYVWKLKFKEDDTDNVIEDSGTITLIR